MTHFFYIFSSYALGIFVPFGFSITAFIRMRAVARKLAAIDPRTNP